MPEASVDKWKFQQQVMILGRCEYWQNTRYSTPQVTDPLVNCFTENSNPLSHCALLVQYTRLLRPVCRVLVLVPLTPASQHNS